MKLSYKKKFKKLYQKLDKDMQDKIDFKIRLFSENPFLKELNNHALQWILKWKRSINVTGDFRLIFIELSPWNYEIIEFIDMWTHSRLYK